MKGSECRLVEYMEGAKKRFIIPVYQRNYDWKIEQCKQLYDDLVHLIKNNRKSHFFGSIVSVYEPSGKNTEFLVIDGQQRLTTVSLLLLAMHNLIAKGVIAPQDCFLEKQIYEEFLVDKYQPKETRMKLKPVKNDQKALDRLFGDSKEYIRTSNLTTNYNYFCDRIQKQEITIDELFEAIYRLQIINITLNSEDDPQLIFESLNSTGLDLSEGDKIRNYVLMRLPTQLQSDYYESYWNPIEECTGYEVSAFARDYLSVKQMEIPSQRRVYQAFKQFVGSTGIDTENLLKDMLRYAKRYQILLKGKTQSKVLNACIYRLNRLETTVTRPFFLEILRLQDENRLDIAQVERVFLLTENYLLRRMVCELPTGVLNKIFLMLHREIIRYDGTEDNYLEKLKYALISKKEKARFPEDGEFSAMFAERPIYLMNSKNKVYILERLENYDTAEDKDVYRHCEDGEYTIEHIMPQHLTPAWVAALGPDYQKIHDTWLHRIANITLTAYNGKYSNSSFEEKKRMGHGFLESGIRMNQYIAQKQKWTVEEMEERSKLLTQRACEVWSYPETTFRPKGKQLDVYTLDDDTELRGRDISRFTFHNTEQPVGSWVEMFVRILKILWEKDSSVIANLAESKEDGVAGYFDVHTSEFRKSAEIADGYYVNTNTSTQTKTAILKKVFKLYGIEPADLTFYLRDDNTEEEAGSRFELRRRYWAYALPMIQEAHGVNGAFRNVKTSRENWLSGFVGISGFTINCVANFDGARVDFFMANAQMEENKKAFDYLKEHQMQIEAEFGASLHWNRSDDTKSSKIFYCLEGVSIERELDWPQMAAFHAKWSKRLYDALVPILKREI